MKDFLLYYALFFAMCSVFAVYIIYTVILLLSHRQVWSMLNSFLFSKFREMSGSEHVPPVSILVPSYNEELTILESVRSLLTLQYPNYEVIVVNDGSKDGTLQKLIDEYDLSSISHYSVKDTLKAKPVKAVYVNPAYPKLIVVDKDNGGKEDALNVGINLSRHPLVCTIDADSLLEKDALLRLARSYMESPDETIAIGGNVRVANGCLVEGGIVKQVNLPKKKILPLFQSIEYLRSFLGGRIGWSAVNGLVIVSGAFGLFRKDYLLKVGGYGGGFPGEDMNVILKLHQYMLERNEPYRILFCPDAICWTQAPDSLEILASQRRRWSRGNLKNILLFRHMLFFIPKYKALGFLSLPYTIFFFETLAPYLKLTGYIALLGYFLMDMSNLDIILMFIGINMLLGILFSSGALIIEEMAFNRFPKGSHLAKLMLYSVLMSFGYDQLNNWWKFLGHVDYIRNKETWGVMERKSWNEDVPVQAAGLKPQAMTNQAG